MKCCFISPGYRTIEILRGNSNLYGGAETQMAYIASAFVKLGHQVDLLYGSGETQLTRQNIEGVTCVNAFPAWRRPTSLRTYWQALQQSAADLFYANLPDDFLWMAGLAAKRRATSRFVYAIASDAHCNPWRTFDYNPWFHNPLYALGLRSAGALSLQHQQQMELVKPHVRGKRVLVPNLVQSIASQTRDIAQTSIDVIWVALIRPVKQLQVLLDVAEKLPHIRFTVVGSLAATFDLQERRSLEQRLQSLPNLDYKGPLPPEDVFRLIQQSKILVNTSLWEGFPNTMLEAWSVGTPVVSLNVDPGGVIRHEEMGFVSGTVATLIDNIQHLVRDPSLNHEMGEKALAYVRKNHSLEALCRAFERIMPETRIWRDGSSQGTT